MSRVWSLRRISISDLTVRQAPRVPWTRSGRTDRIARRTNDRHGSSRWTMRVRVVSSTPIAHSPLLTSISPRPQLTVASRQPVSARALRHPPIAKVVSSATSNDDHDHDDDHVKATTRCGYNECNFETNKAIEKAIESNCCRYLLCYRLRTRGHMGLL